MSCGYKEKIILYFYGELPQSAAEEVRAHIDICADCAAGMAMLGSLSDRFSSFAQQVPVLDAEELLRAARPMSVAELFSYWSRRLAVGAAFTVLFLMAFMSAGGGAGSGWTGPDTALDEVESGIYNLSEDIASSADFDYEYADIETRRGLV